MSGVPEGCCSAGKRTSGALSHEMGLLAGTSQEPCVPLSPHERSYLVAMELRVFLHLREYCLLEKSENRELIHLVETNSTEFQARCVACLRRASLLSEPVLPGTSFSHPTDLSQSLPTPYPPSCHTAGKCSQDTYSFPTPHPRPFA
ncbi:hypothetical protein CEXT_32351 [Caerostris extrusa]|uniref:Uncharacterized protein n=1 Tax=Caerostris extrusa TaxID=172846 RepID=A0AAV4RNJ2_CAEEX|nr:hypothetical protein CEXT_32351 [Caerostris extrusa]